MVTDVLSFPLYTKNELDDFLKSSKVFKRLPLGDIVISLPCAKRQALAYGHSFEREISFLVIHGFYHLLGFDHKSEEEEKLMFEKQKKVLAILGLSR